MQRGIAETGKIGTSFCDALSGELWQRSDFPGRNGIFAQEPKFAGFFRSWPIKADSVIGNLGVGDHPCNQINENSSDIDNGQPDPFVRLGRFAARWTGFVNTRRLLRINLNIWITLGNFLCRPRSYTQEARIQFVLS